MGSEIKYSGNESEPRECLRGGMGPSRSVRQLQCSLKSGYMSKWNDTNKPFPVHLRGGFRRSCTGGRKQHHCSCMYGTWHNPPGFPLEGPGPFKSHLAVRMLLLLLSPVGDASFHVTGLKHATALRPASRVAAECGHTSPSCTAGGRMCNARKEGRRISSKNAQIRPFKYLCSFWSLGVKVCGSGAILYKEGLHCQWV